MSNNTREDWRKYVPTPSNPHPQLPCKYGLTEEEWDEDYRVRGRERRALLIKEGLLKPSAYQTTVITKGEVEKVILKEPAYPNWPVLRMDETAKRYVSQGKAGGAISPWEPSSMPELGLEGVDTEDEALYWEED